MERSGNDNLVVTVDNTGSETLSVEAIDLLVDNDYRTGYGTTVDVTVRRTSGVTGAIEIPSPRSVVSPPGEVVAENASPKRWW